MNSISQYKKDNKDKNILIWGLGLQGGGESAVRFFSQFSTNIRITDLKSQSQLKSTLDNLKNFNLEFTLGEHKQSDFEWADVVLVNQDIFNKAPNSPFLSYIKQSNKQLETQTGLFFKLCQCPIIGVTGTRGKTTTTIAISKLLKNAGYNILLGGNIPDSQNLADIEKTKDLDFAILELSNFQLHGLAFEKLSPHIAIVTSISPDHLISYQNQDNYIKDKVNITRFQKESDYLIIKDSIQQKDRFINSTKSQVMQFNSQTLPEDYQLKLAGIHNRENLSAVFKLGEILKINQALIKETITNFTSVKYRLEKIIEHNGVSFINDTTASTPTAANIALKSFPAGKIIWIAGGNTKNLPINDLVQTASQSVKNYVFLKGTGTKDLISELEKTDPQFVHKNLGLFDNFERAVKIAFSNSEAGDTILLSPGFTSFGMFNNEFERGDLFNQYVSELIPNKK